MNRSLKLGIVLSLFVALSLCLSACGSRDSSAAPVDAQASRATPSPLSTPLEPKATKSYSDEFKVEDDDKGDDEEESDTEAQYFHGYRCTIDCSGHEAGYKWAEEHGIDDPDECGGKSRSFIEGCRAWAEENP